MSYGIIDKPDLENVITASINWSEIITLRLDEHIIVSKIADAVLESIKEVNTKSEFDGNPDIVDICHHQMVELYYATNRGIMESPFEACFKCWKLRRIEE
jgi:hypothetical protein